MTERWRKKLGDLDGASPSDDVFARAHDGPQQPDPMVPGPSTANRVATGIAAFTVFALAISVFAIPALRMNGPAAPGSTQILPLWPERSLDDLEALQAAADSGDPDAVWATDPLQVALRFGREVLAWERPFLVSVDPQLTSTACLDFDAPSELAICVDPSSGDVLSMGTVAPGTSTPTLAQPASFRIILGTEPCDTTGSCSFPAITISMEQPLGAGMGAVWAVTSVESNWAGLDVAEGASVSDHDVLRANVTAINGGELFPVLGYRADLGECETTSTTDRYRRVGIEADPQLTDATPDTMEMGLPVRYACPSSSPGYVWASLSSERPTSSVIDPFTQTPASPLLELTAVPVVFTAQHATGVFTELPPTGSTPTATEPFPPNRWVVSTIEEFGFSIDVPGDVSGSEFAEEVGWVLPGGGRVLITPLDEAPPADDSEFPIDISTVPDISDVVFRGDGRAFRFITATPDPDGRDLPTVTRMLSSIRFEPWEVGESRNGWTAVSYLSANSTAEFFVFDGEHFFTTRSADGRALFGPVPDCAEGKSTPGLTDNDLVVMTCQDGSRGMWNLAGVAEPENPPRFDVNLNSHPAIRSWDGKLLMYVVIDMSNDN